MAAILGQSAVQLPNSLEIFSDQIRIDRERRLRALGGRDDYPLDRARRVARHVQPGKMRGLVPSGLHSTLWADLTAERGGELRMLGLSFREKQGAARQRRAA